METKESRLARVRGEGNKFKPRRTPTRREREVKATRRAKMKGWMKEC